MNYHNLPHFIFEDCLGEEMHELGFVMDCGKPIAAAFPESGDLLDIKEFKEILPFIDIQTLGNAIFSNWRFWTHWTIAPMEERECQWFRMAFKRLAELTET